MTQKKLEIIGPYTPEHEGPFCMGNGRPVRLLTRLDGSKKFPIVGYIDDADHPAFWSPHGHIYNRHTRDVHDNTNDLMNAREVPIAREFWINAYPDDESYCAYSSESEARENLSPSIGHTVHVREVLPGDEE